MRKPGGLDVLGFGFAVFAGRSYTEHLPCASVDFGAQVKIEDSKR